MQCPRCAYDQQFYKSPPGKVVRNPAALGVWDDCQACNGTGSIPEVVLESIKNALPKQFAEIQADPKLLRWSGDHYSFMCGGMYVGVEVKDGYLHT